MNEEVNLIIFIEGPDDERFFRKYFEKYSNVIPYKYAVQKKENVKKYLKSLRSMNNCDYLFFADADGKNVEEKKKEIIEKFGIYDESKVFIVCCEIESWYLAGLNNASKQKLKIKKRFNCTDKLTKEFFVSTMPSQFESKIDYMIEILKNYDFNFACDKNKSYSSFKEKVA